MAENINDRLAREWTDGLIDTERAPDGTTIPVPVEDLASLVRTVKALKSAVDQLTGRAGTAYDKPLTLRDLVDGGLTSLRIGSDVIGAGSFTAPGGGGSTIVPANPDGPGYKDPRPVLAVPPTLTNVAAYGAFRNVIVVWKRTEYRNHAYVEVWRAGVNNLSLAVRIGTTTANIFADATGSPDTTYWYWARAVNIEGVIGPFNAVEGSPGTLAPLVDAEVPPQFIKHAMIGLLAVDDGNIANLNAAKVNFGEMSGDRIAVNTLVGDRIMVNTLLGDRLISNSVTADKVNGYNLRVMSGGFSGFAWPAAGLFGFYLGPEGLLLGNANNGQYFQVNFDGSVVAPGLTIAGGSASFSGSITAGTTITAPSIVGGTVTGATVSATTINGGTINGGTLNATVVSVGPSASATAFIDPAQPSVPLMSFCASTLNYTGYAATNPGSGWIPTYVYGDDSTFKNNDATWDINRRVRTGNVLFVVTVSGAVQDYITAWYRRNGGSWTHIITATEFATGQGTATTTKALTLTIGAGDVIEFAMTATDAAGGLSNNGADLSNGALTVLAKNF